MQVRSLGFVTDVLVRRLGGAEIVDGDDFVVVRSPDNPNFWWGNFVLVPGWAQVGAGVERFTASFPHASHLAVGVDVTEGEQPAGGIPEGLAADVSTVLAAAPEELAPPAAVEADLRELRGPGDWDELLRLRWEEAEADGPPAALDRPYQVARVAEARRLVEGGHGAYLGAWVDDHLVSTLGVVSDGSGLARYQHVQTAPAYRRRGLAGRLVVDAAAVARRRWAARRLVIVADPDGPAIGLYRSLGFTPAEAQVQLQRA